MKLAILKKEGENDVNIYYYNSLIPGDWSYWDCFARNPSPLARDYWQAPAGNDAAGLVQIDAGDGGNTEIAIIKKTGVDDVNLYYYNNLAASDWSYWDARSRNPSPLARDYWFIPSGNDVLGVATVDVDGDGQDELSILKKGGDGDVNIYYYQGLLAGDWTYWDADSRNTAPIARDFWQIPIGNDAVGITAIKTE